MLFLCSPVSAPLNLEVARSARTSTRSAVVKKKFKEILHQYKVEAFKIAHNNEQIAEHTGEILQFTEQALKTSYHYQFHKEPDKDRLETLTMIKNFTLEALMPPIVERLMRRIIVLECQQAEMVKLVDHQDSRCMLRS